MGLSAISSALRRHKPTAKTVRPSLSSPSISSIFQTALPLCLRDNTSAPSAPRKLRFRDLSASEIVDKLAGVEHVVSQEQTNALAEYLVSNDSIFTEFVSLATATPSDTAGPPRERCKGIWVVATLLRYGPPTLRETLAQKPQLIQLLASVYNAPQGKLDPSLASHVADVLKVLLHEYPKEVATALYNTSIVSHLVTHIYLQPAADLLPRLVGTPVFTSLTPAPVIPAHKRATAMLGKARVQDALAQRFIAAADAVLNGDRDAIQIAEKCCQAMAKISVRALSLPRKPEDHDERGDTGYAGNLLIVAAHVYNDAKDHMNLIQEPQPLLDVLAHAMKNMAKREEVLVPALNMTSAVLQCLRQSRFSPLLATRKVVLDQDTLSLGKGLASLSREFAHILSEGSRFVGRKRLAVMDLLREACTTIEESSVDDLLCANGFEIIQALLTLLLAHRNNDILLVTAAQTLSGVFDNCNEVAGKALKGTNLSKVLDELKAEIPMKPALASLVACQGVDNVMRDGDERLKRQLSALEEYYDENVKEHEERGLVKGTSFVRPKISEESARILELEEELGTSKDYRQDVFIHGLLREIGEPETGEPPTESRTRHAAHEAAIVWTKGLTKLKTHGHNMIGA